MSFKDLLGDTFHTLVAHKRRTALTMFGITWGIVSITLMVAAGQGLGTGFERKKAEFGRDILIVFAGRTNLQAGGVRAGRQVQWTASDHLQVQRDSASCRYVMPELGHGGTPVRSSYNNASVLVTGSLPPFAEIRSIGVAEGRYHIRTQFLVEALVLTLAGGALGILLAWGITALAPRLPMFGPLFEDESGQGDLQLAMSGSVALVSTFVLVLVGAVSGLVPALKASRLDPVEALRYE